MPDLILQTIKNPVIYACNMWHLRLSYDHIGEHSNLCYPFIVAIQWHYYVLIKITIMYTISVQSYSNCHSIQKACLKLLQLKFKPVWWSSATLQVTSRRERVNDVVCNGDVPWADCEIHICTILQLWYLCCGVIL